MFRSKMIPFGEFAPDTATVQNPTVLVRNVVASPSGYLPVKGMESGTNAIVGPALGAFWVRGSNQVYYIFAGDPGALYQLTGQNFADISKAGGYDVESWEFVKWGDRIIAASR